MSIIGSTRAILALALVFSWLGLLAGRADETIRVSLYLAGNNSPSADRKLAPEKMEHRLVSVFGFKYYELIKEEEIELGKEWEQWVVPRKDFFIRLKPLPRESSKPRTVDYEIYKDGFIVARGTYEPHKGTPLFINGPDFKQSRFIYVLEAR